MSKFVLFIYVVNHDFDNNTLTHTWYSTRRASTGLWANGAFRPFQKLRFVSVGVVVLRRPKAASEGRLEFRLQTGKTSSIRVNAELQTDNAYRPTAKSEWQG